MGTNLVVTNRHGGLKLRGNLDCEMLPAETRSTRVAAQQRARGRIFLRARGRTEEPRFTAPPRCGLADDE
jgi:hypothetical protein